MFKIINLNLGKFLRYTARLKSSTSQATDVFNGDLFGKVITQRSAATNGKTFEVLNPLNGKLLCRVPDRDVSETQELILKSHQAFHSWKKVAVKERCAMMMNLHDLVLKNKQHLAQIITLENGKPLQESLSEVLYGADYLKWFAEEGKRVYGDVIQPSVNDRRCFVIKEPVGVCGMITPWNFPHAMAARKVAPALVVGCTVLLKPSEETPLSALAFSELAREAGFPEGVFSVVTCSKENTGRVGEEICTSALVKKISFTGSTQVGKMIMVYASSNVKKLSLELGGNAAFIVFESAHLDLAVEALMAGKFRSSGQTCVSPNRIFLHEKIHDDFVSKLKEAIKSQLRLGDGLCPSTTQGPLINHHAVERVMTHVTDAESKGAKVEHGGRRRSWAAGGGEIDGVEDSSSFMEPTILTGVTADCLCFHEETFGPLIPVFRFSSEKEVVELANNTTSGLAGYFFSRDHDQIWRVAEALEVGMVGANIGLIGLSQMPFGGVKESGYGREGSKYGLDDYLVIKSIHMGLDLN